jgi:hypothetical protein
MPTIRNSFDCSERTHVHARRERRTCKFWLDPLELAQNHHFAPRELSEIRRLVQDHRGIIVAAWHEHCG